MRHQNQIQRVGKRPRTLVVHLAGRTLMITVPALALLVSATRMQETNNKRNKVKTKITPCGDLPGLHHPQMQTPRAELADLQNHLPTFRPQESVQAPP